MDRLRSHISDSGHHEVPLDEGGDNWAVIATLIECCKLSAINPHKWLTQTLASLANGHPANRVGELMPWTAVG
jgi:transposase